MVSLQYAFDKKKISLKKYIQQKDDFLRYLEQNLLKIVYDALLKINSDLISFQKDAKIADILHLRKWDVIR